MKFRLIGPAGWGVAFVLVASLVVGGLGWVTVASLRVEAAQLEATARADRANQERLALWRLDGHLLPALGLENNRPFGHYSTLYTQYPVWDAGQDAPASGALQLASPLLSADLPPWMLLHFQLDPELGWESPQVIAPEMADRLHTNFSLTLTNVTPLRASVLEDLRKRFPADEALASLVDRERASPDDNPFVVPIPLADETATSKPPGLVPGEADPGQARPYGTGAELIATPPGEILSKLSRELWAVPRDALGRGRSNGHTIPSAEFRMQSAPPRVGAMPTPAPLERMAPKSSQSPREGVASVPPYTVPLNQAAQAPQAPSKVGSQEQKPDGDYPARNRTIQEASKQRGALENNLQGFKPGLPQPAPSEKDKSIELPATPPLPAPGGPPGPPAPTAGESKSRRPTDEKADPKLKSVQGSKKKVAADRMAEKKMDEAKPAGMGGFGVPGLAAPSGEFAPGAGGRPLDRVDRGDARKQPEGAMPGAELKPAEAPSGPKPTKESVPDGIERGTKKTAPTVQPVNVQVGPLRPVWLTADGSEALALVRAARMEGKIVFQGVLLDWSQLQAVLGEQVADLFPSARLSPVRVIDPTQPPPNPERAMTALPVQLDPGPAPEPPPAGWSTLRIGLLMAWAAALLGLIAVGFGGRALVDLSERRIRFVSAVTHELRTPLTSLRLYLDLLNSGMISDEQKQKEYLNTLACESERLHRLIENVLDFARLERRSVETHTQPTNVAAMLDDVRQTWAERCSSEGRELVVISTLPPEQQVTTDPRIAAQVLGNLVDNARKYSRDADDGRIWVWAKPGERGRLLLEVEDRGPGVAVSERGTIFRPFRRGRDADTTAGGAGLGLALAKHWADLLGGTLSYRVADGGVGACFRLELPARVLESVQEVYRE